MVLSDSLFVDNFYYLVVLTPNIQGRIANGAYHYNASVSIRVGVIPATYTYAFISVWFTFEVLLGIKIKKYKILPSN